jgi:hypothetical protein
MTSGHCDLAFASPSSHILVLFCAAAMMAVDQFPEWAKASLTSEALHIISSSFVLLSGTLYFFAQFNYIFSRQVENLSFLLDQSSVTCALCSQYNPNAQHSP